MRWVTRREERDDVTRAFLERDRDWAAYLLADLDPPHRRHARFYLTAADGVDRALLLVYTPPEFVTISAMGEAEGIASALMQTPDLPERTFLVIPDAHREPFAVHYQVARWERMQRMILAPANLRLPGDCAGIERLAPDDEREIDAVFASREDRPWFAASMLETGVYCGIREAGRLIAVAGTHVFSLTGRFAAIGNVYTAPEARGRGYATATSAAVAQALCEAGCERIILNVSVENRAAIRVYERLGFTKYIEFWAGPAIKRGNGPRGRAHR